MDCEEYAKCLEGVLDGLIGEQLTRLSTKRYVSSRVETLQLKRHVEILEEALRVRRDISFEVGTLLDTLEEEMETSTASGGSNFIEWIQKLRDRLRRSIDFAETDQDELPPMRVFTPLIHKRMDDASRKDIQGSRPEHVDVEAQLLEVADALVLLGEIVKTGWRRDDRIPAFFSIAGEKVEKALEVLATTSALEKATLEKNHPSKWKSIAQMERKRRKAVESELEYLRERVRVDDGMDGSELKLKRTQDHEDTALSASASASVAPPIADMTALHDVLDAFHDFDSAPNEDTLKQFLSEMRSRFGELNAMAMMVQSEHMQREEDQEETQMSMKTGRVDEIDEMPTLGSKTTQKHLHIFQVNANDRVSYEKKKTAVMRRKEEADAMELRHGMEETAPRKEELQRKYEKSSKGGGALEMPGEVEDGVPYDILVLRDKVAQLESEMKTKGRTMSQAQKFALKKKIAMEKSKLIREERNWKKKQQQSQ